MKLFMKFFTNAKVTDIIRKVLPFKKGRIIKILPKGMKILQFSNNHLTTKLILEISEQVLTSAKTELERQNILLQHEKNIKTNAGKICGKKQRDIAILLSYKNPRQGEKKQIKSEKFSNDIQNLNHQSNFEKVNQEGQNKKPFVVENFGKVFGFSSCKGGVGKSTIAYRVANLLAASGKKVGFLDLDIYGPSTPTLLNYNGKFEVNEDKKLIPIEKDGVFYASVGFVAEGSAGLVWRGPMISKLINSLVLNCAWQKMDYMILDLPPGTGDAYLSFFQNFACEGLFLVSTDNSLACSDLARSIAAFSSLNINILGCVQNMADIYNDNILQNLCETNNIKIFDKINFSHISNIKPLNVVEQILYN